MQCKSLTKAGVQCTKKAQYLGYCNYHIKYGVMEHAEQQLIIQNKLYSAIISNMQSEMDPQKLKMLVPVIKLFLDLGKNNTNTNTNYSQLKLDDLLGINKHD